jgi:hypothetical protein
MKKTHRRRGSKGEGARKKERRKRAAKALAAAGAIAGGTYAYADPVRHDNPPHGEPGHFHWPTSGPVFLNMLDIALPAGAQPGSAYATTSIENQVSGGAASFNSYTGYGRLQTTPYGFALSFNAGDPVPNPSGVCSFYGDPFCFSPSGYLHYPGYNYVPEGVPAYLAAAVGGAYCTYYNDCQYGWIGVVRTGAELEAFAWGFESTPNTPINAGDPQPAEPTGACCDDPTATCTEDVTQADCEGAGSRWGGDGSDCATIDPPCVAGACCDDATAKCNESVTQKHCEDAGSRWGGDGSDCATIDPACVAGACCGPGPCTDQGTEVNCDAKSGKFRGAATTCEVEACNNIPTVSEWGLFAMSLGLLAAGAWVVKKRIPQAEPPVA